MCICVYVHFCHFIDNTLGSLYIAVLHNTILHAWHDTSGMVLKLSTQKVKPVFHGGGGGGDIGYNLWVQSLGDLWKVFHGLIVCIKEFITVIPGSSRVVLWFCLCPRCTDVTAGSECHGNRRHLAPRTPHKTRKVWKKNEEKRENMDIGQLPCNAIVLW